jgi:hypothetical protein
MQMRGDRLRFPQFGFSVADGPVALFENSPVGVISILPFITFREIARLCEVRYCW